MAIRFIVDRPYIGPMRRTTLVLQELTVCSPGLQLCRRRRWLEQSLCSTAPWTLFDCGGRRAGVQVHVDRVKSQEVFLRIVNASGQ